MNSRNRRPALCGVLVMLLLGACRDSSGKGGSGNWQGEITHSGDTTTVHTRSGSILGDLGTIPAESLEIVYAGEGILQSTVVATSSDRLLIGEGTQVVVIDPSGNIDTLGREGDGPGEFRRIIALRGDGDTVVALDANSNRLTRFAPTGTPTSTTVEPPPDYAQLTPSDLGRCQSSTMITWRPGFVMGDRPPDTVAVVWWKPGVPPTTWLRVPDISWTNIGGMYGPKYAFGPHALIAGDGNCRVASTDGVSYALQMKNAATDSTMFITVAELAPPVTAEDKTIPERWRSEWPAAMLPAILDRIEHQEYAERRNSLEAVQFDVSGRLWARVVDSTYHYHRWVSLRVAEARPATYRWDVFGTAGKRLAIVHLPSNFSPKVWSGRWVYGIAEQEDGTLVVGRLPVPEELH